MICGGFNEKSKKVSKVCFDPLGQNPSISMEKPRARAASVVLGQNLWVTGGTDDSETFQTTEIINFNKIKKGPNLPLKMKGRVAAISQISRGTRF